MKVRDSTASRMNWILGTIVVASDGTPDASAQLDSARALARATGARIVVAYVNPIARGRVASHPVHAHEDGLLASVRSQVAALRSLGLRAELAVQPATHRVASALATVAAEHHADLVVVRRSRQGWGRRRSLGLIARKLGRSVRCPLLIVD